MQICYVVTDNFSTTVFVQREALKKFLTDKILTKMKDMNFCLSVFKSFRKHHSNADFFQMKLERLVELARQDQLDELVRTWNDLFPDDAIDTVQAELVQISKE
jgi:hypothetical protein